MCPEPQILSIYIDGELPSPWDEKLKAHLNECSVCREKLESFKRLQDLLKKDTKIRRTIVDKRIVKLPSAGYEPDEQHQEFLEEPELIDAAQKRIWKNLTSRQRYKSNTRIWKRKLTIPVPAAAAAAIVITLMAGLWVRGETILFNNLIKKQNEAAERVNFILAAEEDMSSISTTADIYGVFQYLSSGSTDIIILELPPETSFHRTGEPAIIRAADYQRNEVQRNRSQRDGTQRNNVHRDGNHRGRSSRNEIQGDGIREDSIPRIRRNYVPENYVPENNVPENETPRSQERTRRHQ